MWTKRGLIFSVDAANELCLTHAAIPFAMPIGGGRHRIYFAARDVQSRSRTFFFDADLERRPVDCVFSPRQALDLGELGAFDDSGAMPSWIEVVDGRSMLFYTGWSLGKTVPFYLSIGAAISTDGGATFRRVSRAPILGRTAATPLLTASPCILREGGLWRMWFVSGERWEHEHGTARHYYNIGYAESSDGTTWTPAHKPHIDFASDDEHAFGRPCVVKVPDGYLMWFSVRGERYRLGLACSRDGHSWRRVDDAVGILPSVAGFDAEMIAYAHVFRGSAGWLMLYNGNDYGKSGIGLASCETLPTVESLSKFD